MENSLITAIESLSAIVKNTRLSLSLEGWPATVTVIAVCVSGVALYALKVTHPSVGADESSAPA